MEIAGTPIATGVLTPTVATKIPNVDKLRANAVMITVETQVARMVVDGPDVSATTGHVLAVGGPYYFKGAQQVQNMQFIDTAAGPSKVRYTTYRTDD